MVAAILCATLLPTLCLVISNSNGASISGMLAILRGPFIGAFKRSFLLGSGVAATGLALGWPGGTAIGLVRFPGRRLFLAILTLPLFTPSFLWAIGMSSFRPFLAYRHQWWLDGFPGALLTGAVQTLPLVALASFLSTRTIPVSQLDAAQLFGGFRAVFKASARFTAPASLAAAMLGSALALVDPGSAQIMGYHGVASEILIAFSARYDAGLAARKALLTTLLLLPVILVVAWKVSIWSETRLLGRDVRKAKRRFQGLLPSFIVLGFVLVALALLFPALTGLTIPLRGTQTLPALKHALTTLRDSCATTLRYGFTAAIVATTLGMAMALACGRKHWLRLGLLLFSCLFLALPPSVHALGFADLAAHVSKSWDWLLRGGNGVGIAFGLRLVPIPALFCLRAWSLMPESCRLAGMLHGVPGPRYFWRVALPQLRPALLWSSLLVALVSVADVSSTLLLLPPGGATFTTRIFGVIDNTSQCVLAALCLVYLASGFLGLCLVSLAARLVTRREET